MSYVFGRKCPAWRVIIPGFFRAGEKGRKAGSREEEPEERYIAFATNRPGIDVDRYAERWMIETGFRMVENERVRTRSRSVTVRTLCFLYSLVLYNAWVLANAELTGNPLTLGGVYSRFTQTDMKVIMLMESFLGVRTAEGRRPIRTAPAAQVPHAAASAPPHHFRGSPYGAACRSNGPEGRAPPIPGRYLPPHCIAAGPTLRTGPSFCAMQGSQMACCAPAHPNCTRSRRTAHVLASGAWPAAYSPANAHPRHWSLLS